MTNSANKINLWTFSLIAAVSLMATVLTRAQETASTAPQGAQSDGSQQVVGSSDKNKKDKQRIREGAIVEETIGNFVVTGDRITFYPEEGPDSFRALENLALERVALVLSETREKRAWVVSGTITEFQGSNYLLVTRAMVKPRSYRKPGDR